MYSALSDLLRYLIFAVFAGALLIGCAFLLFRRNSSSKYRLPPGPKGWPFIGYISFVLSETPHVLLRNLSQEYGKVFGFYVGSRYCVVLSDFKSMKEALCRKAFLPRPPGLLSTAAHKNFTELELADFETERKFFINCTKLLGVGSSRFEEVVLDELSRVIPKVEGQVGKGDFSLRDAISVSISNTIMQMICSRWFEDEHPFMKQFSRFLTLAAESFSNNNAVIYFPWMSWLLTKFQNHAKEILKSMGEIEAFIRSEVEAREKMQDESSNHDYIDMYLKEVKYGNHYGYQFKKETLIANTLILLMGGTDTTRNTIEWLVMAMAAYPDIQEKVHQEIVSVLGRDRTPMPKDKSSLPYTEACILESSRWKVLAPLNVARWTSEETIIQGFRIPKNTVVINNLWQCLMDPNYAKNPDEFRPDRYLSPDGQKVTTPEYLVPFSIGRRSCPGDKVANIEIFMYFTTLMQRFKFLPPPGGVSFKAAFRVNQQAIKPILRVELR